MVRVCICDRLRYMSSSSSSYIYLQACLQAILAEIGTKTLSALMLQCLSLTSYGYIFASAGRLPPRRRAAEQPAHLASQGDRIAGSGLPPVQTKDDPNPMKERRGRRRGDRTVTGLQDNLWLRTYASKPPTS